MISIYPVLHNKKQYLDLLLLADEQESMIDRYLERGEMFVLTDAGNIKAACVVTREADKEHCHPPAMPTAGIWQDTDRISFQAVCRQMPNYARGYGRQSSDRSLL